MKSIFISSTIESSHIIATVKAIAPIVKSIRSVPYFVLKFDIAPLKPKTMSSNSNKAMIALLVEKLSPFGGIGVVVAVAVGWGVSVPIGVCVIVGVAVGATGVLVLSGLGVFVGTTGNP